MKKFLDKLRTTIWRTSSSRYNAARRYKTKEIFSTISLALLSAATIAVPIFEKTYVVSGSEADKALDWMSICLGLFLLVVSLIEWGSATGIKAESLHRNAESLTHLRLKVELLLEKLGDGLSISWNDIDCLREEYEQVKDKCPYNHSPLDSNYFDVSRRNDAEFMQSIGNPSYGFCKILWINLCWRIRGLEFFIIAWLVIALLGWKIFTL